MQKSDYNLIGEKYDQILTSEGFFDQVKAQGANLAGSLRGVKDRAVGTVKGALAGATGDTAGVQAGAQQRAQGQIQGQLAKIESYKKSVATKIEKLNNEIINDLQKLGLAPRGVSPKSINNFKLAVDRGLQDLLDQVKASVAPATPPSTPPTP